MMKRLLPLCLLAVTACQVAPSIEQEARIPGLSTLVEQGRGTRFLPDATGRLRADRGELNAIAVTVGQRYADGLSVARPDDPEARLTLTPEHGNGSLETRPDGVARYGLPRVHAEALISTSHELAEEIVVIQDAAGPQSLRYRLSHGSKVQRVRLNGAELEAVDERGQLLLRSPQPRILDAAGRSVMGHYALEGDLLTVRWPTEGLTYPIAVDPSVTSSTGPKLALIAGITSSNVHDFGSLPKNLVGSTASASSPATFTLLSAGSSAVTINSLNSSNTTYFTLGSTAINGTNVTLPQTLQPGSTLTFQVIFSAPSTATSGSQVSANITASSTDPAGPTLQVRGTPVSATATGAFPVQASGEKLHMDQTYVGTSMVRYVDIFPGSLTGTFTCSSAPTTTDTQFTASSACTSGLNINNGQVHIPITFVPGAASAQSGTITITTSSPSSATYKVDIDGTGISPSTSPSGDSAFGNVRKGTSNTQTPFISNSGTAYDYGSVAISGPYAGKFALSPSATRAVVPPGGDWSWNVTFSPTETAVETATLTFTSSVASTKTINLSGTGVFPNIAQPILVSVGNVRKGTSKQMPAITFNNTGSDFLNITSVSISSSVGNPNDFQVPLANSLNIAAGGSATVTPTFKPTMTGAESAVAVFNAGDFGTITVVLSGTGIFPQVSVNSSPLAFSSMRVGSTSEIRAVNIVNNGTDVLTLSSFAFSAGGSTTDFAFSGTVPSTIAVGSSATYNFTFTPSTTGAISGAGIFNAGDYGNVQVDLTGTGIKPDATLTATSLAFGTTKLGASLSKSVAITSSGSDNLVVNGFTVTGSGASDFTVSPTSSMFGLIPGATSSFLVTFTPSTGGTRAATLTFNTDAGAKTVTLTGTGTAPTANYSATLVDFGSQRKGTNSNANSITLSNTGNDTLKVSSFYLTGANVGDFSVTHAAAPFTVNAGGNTAFNVVFSPSKTGAESATLVIISELGEQAIALTGTGIYPNLALSTSTLDLGNQQVGTTSGAVSLFINNTGTDTATISSKTVGGSHPNDFTISLPGTVAAGGTGTVTVRFTPSVSGAESAPVTISTDAGTLSFMVTGNGVAPSVAVSTASLTFPNQIVRAPSVPQTVTLTNVGGAALTINSAAISGANAGDFMLSAAPTFPLSIAVGSSLSLAVVFTPSNATAESATLTASFGSGILPVSVTLQGNGISSATTVFPSSLTFGGRRVGTTSSAQGFQISNNSSDVLKVTGFSISGAPAGVFAVTPANGTVSIDPGASALWSATFTPSTTGAQSASVNFTTDHGGVAVALSGTGTFPTTVVNANVLDLGSTPKNTPSQPQGFSVTNAGTDTLNISSFSITGPDKDDFALVSAGTVTVAAGATSSAISVVFTPSHTGTETATLRFVTDNGAETVALTGVGTFPNVVASTSSFAFGTVSVGDTSAAQTVVLANTGTGSASITAAISGAANGPFRIASGGTAQTLAAGQTATWTVTFAPSQAGAVTANLVFTTPSGNLTVSLAGTGVGGTYSVARLAPETLNFAPLRVGTTQDSQTITLCNTGTATLTVRSYSVTGDASFFSVTPGSGGLSIAPSTGGGDPCDPASNPTNDPRLGSFSWTVSTIATAPGGRIATISFNTDGGNPTATLAGKGLFPETTLSANALMFGNIRKGVTSTAQTIAITNSGDSPLSVSSIAVTGTNAADFSVTGTPAPFTLPNNGASTTLSVKFTPSTAAFEQASLALTTDNGVFTVPLSGTGVFPSLTASLSTMAFGGQRKAVASAPQVLTLTNTGTDVLNISGFAVSGDDAADFAVSPASVATNLAAGASGNWSVTFKPSRLVDESATLTFNTDLGPRTVLLTGTGIAPAISAAPQSMSFTAQAKGTMSDAQQVTLRNTGTDVLAISGFALTGANAGDFLVTPASRGQSLLPGASATWSVIFAPTTSANESATLNIYTEAGNATVSLSGMAIVAPLTISPATADLGQSWLAVVSATTNLTIRNVSSQSFSVTSFAFSGTNASEFSVFGGPTLPQTLPSGASMTVPVVFTPTAAGVRQAVFSATTSAVATTLQVALTGTGVSPVLAVNPTSFDYDDVVVGVPTNQLIQVSNTGTAVMTVQSITLGAGSSDFALVDVPPLPMAIDPGFSTSFSVSFTPTHAGTAQNVVTVVSNSPSDGTAQIPVTGNGVAQTITTTGTALNFGSVRVGSPSPVRTFTLTNTGTQKASVLSARITGSAASEFSMVPVPVTPILLAPGGGYTTIAFAFNPTVHGPRSATATISTTATSAPIQVSLSGVGLVPALNVSPTSLNYGVHFVGAAPTVLAVTLSNDGDAPLHLAAPTLDGSGSGAFELQLPPELATIAENSSVTLPIVFRPDSAGQFAATLHLKSSDTDGVAADIPLAGVGAAPGLSIPDAVDFGLVSITQESASKTVTLTNMNSAPLVITAIQSDSPEFVVTSDELPLTIQGQSSISPTVVFSPLADGVRTGHLLIFTEGSGTPLAIVPLNGTGQSLKSVKVGCTSTGPATAGLLGVALALMAVRRRRRGSAL